MKRIILTGTPAPNHYGDLHAQAFILDNGEALGKNPTTFRRRYMHKGGFQGKEWLFSDDCAGNVEDALAPLVLTMRAEDHLDMPDYVTNDIWVELPSAIAKAYRQIERELFAALADGQTLAASSAGAKYALCKQIANGGAYARDDYGEPLFDDDGQRTALHVHDAKVDAVADLAAELYGKPLLVAYQYKHDLARLLRKWPGAPRIDGGTDAKDCAATCEEWNARKLPILFVQPQAMAHGLNLQAGGNDVVWFGLTDSLEIYDQTNRRIYRQGVAGQVRVHRILTTQTVDVAIRERIEGKGRRQETLLESLKRYAT